MMLAGLFVVTLTHTVLALGPSMPSAAPGAHEDRVLQLG